MNMWSKPKQAYWCSLVPILSVDRFIPSNPELEVGINDPEKSLIVGVFFLLTLRF